MKKDTEFEVEHKEKIEIYGPAYSKANIQTYLESHLL